MACEAECRAFLTIQAGFAYIYIYICILYIYILYNIDILYIYIYYESRPGSWPVVVCERSETRGSGGGSG